MSSATLWSSASLPIGWSAKTGSDATDDSWKLAEANRAERSDSGRLSPSASSRMVVSRGDRRPRSRSETASGLSPARAARVSWERPERLRRRRSSSPNRFIFSLPHWESALPDRQIWPPRRFRATTHCPSAVRGRTIAAVFKICEAVFGGQTSRRGGFQPIPTL